MVTGNGQITGFDSDTEQRDILKLSHGTAIVLLISEFLLLLKRFLPEWSADKVTRFQVYLSYLYFQLFSHKSLYDDKTGPKPETIKYSSLGQVQGEGEEILEAGYSEGSEGRWFLC
jgi:hypothetical protein